MLKITENFDDGVLFLKITFLIDKTFLLKKLNLTFIINKTFRFRVFDPLRIFRVDIYTHIANNNDNCFKVKKKIFAFEMCISYKIYLNNFSLFLTHLE